VRERGGLENSSRKPHTNAEGDIDKIHYILEDRTVKTRVIAKRGFAELHVPVKHRILEECCPFRRSTARWIAMNLKRNWSITKHCSLEINPQPEIEAAETYVLIFRNTEIDPAEIERVIGMAALEGFEYCPTFAGSLQCFRLRHARLPVSRLWDRLRKRKKVSYPESRGNAATHAASPKGRNLRGRRRRGSYDGHHFESPPLHQAVRDFRKPSA
jgi:hypothetical protein